jgi:hypothetical protein
MTRHRIPPAARMAHVFTETRTLEIEGADDFFLECEAQVDFTWDFDADGWVSAEIQRVNTPQGWVPFGTLALFVGLDAVEAAQDSILKNRPPEESYWADMEAAHGDYLYNLRVGK